MELRRPESSHLITKQPEETFPLGWTRDEHGYPQILKNGTLFVWNKGGTPPEGWVGEVISQMPTEQDILEYKKSLQEERRQPLVGGVILLPDDYETEVY